MILFQITNSGGFSDLLGLFLFGIFLIALTVGIRRVLKKS